LQICLMLPLPITSGQMNPAPRTGSTANAAQHLEVTPDPLQPSHQQKLKSCRQQSSCAAAARLAQTPARSPPHNCRLQGTLARNSHSGYVQQARQRGKMLPSLYNGATLSALQSRPDRSNSTSLLVLKKPKHRQAGGLCKR